MKNWSVDIKELKKNPHAFAVWRIEQLINFGIGSEKLRKRDLKKYWNELEIDPQKRAFLSLLIQ